MIRKTLFLSGLLFSLSSYAYEDTFYKLIAESDNDKVLIDVISHDKENTSRHFNFAKKITIEEVGKTLKTNIASFFLFIFHSFLKNPLH